MYKVLLVDDENRITRGLRQIIPWEKLNCVVAGTAYNGEAGLQLAEELKPDILITDIHMPYMDGLEMIALLKPRHRAMKYIILSGYSDFKYAQRGIQLGVDNYVLKPVDERELESSIRKAISDIEEERHAGDPLASTQPQESAPDMQAQHPSGILRKIQAYIDEHYADNLTLVSLADAFYLNPSYLSQLFMKKTNATFLQHLTDVRIRKAVELLRETDLKVYEISSRVGYKDAKYFSKIFEKNVGVKPVDYRHSHGGQ